MKHGYLVMRVHTTVNVKDVDGEYVKVSAIKKGVKGYCPVFTNKKDALRSSDKGKYQILKVREV